MASPTLRYALLIATTLLVTWLVWGASFLAVSVALVDLPPLLLMASRFLVAGAVATGLGLLLARRAGHELPSSAAWRDATLVGIGWISIGMGATGWAGTRLPTGICALLVATAPLWITMLQVLVLRSGTPSRSTMLGLVAGIAGVGLLLAPSSSAAAIDVTAALVLAGSTAAWAAASVYATRAVRPRGLVLTVGMQMLAGGAVLLLASLSLGEQRGVDLASIAAGPAAAWTYLVVAASLAGFLSYAWLLEHVGTTIASTHAFVNPVVAMALGSAVLGETLDARTLTSAGAVVVAVVLLLLGERRPPRVGAPAPDTGRRTARPARAIRPHVPAPVMPRHAIAKRAPRPYCATDGMDALAIDEALDRQLP